MRTVPHFLKICGLMKRLLTCSIRAKEISSFVKSKPCMMQSARRKWNEVFACNYCTNCVHIYVHVRVNHSSLVGFYGAFYRDGAISIALEYMNGGSLANVIAQVLVQQQIVLRFLWRARIFSSSFFNLYRLFFFLNLPWVSSWFCPFGFSVLER